MRSRSDSPRLHHRWTHVLVLAALLLVPLAPRAAAQDPPNIVLAVLDDAGIENFSFYGLRDPGGPYAATPFLDNFVDQHAIIFQNAWSNPVCSPTRAAFHQGEFGFRTGIGGLINDDQTKGLDVSDPNLLPRLLASTDQSTTAYATALFGKWHLGTSADQGDDNAPQEAGYDNFGATFLDQQQGTPSDEGIPFFHFWVTKDGNPDPVTTEFDAQLGGANEDRSIYLSDHMRRAAAVWINAQETAGNTWFAYLPFTAPHQPWGCPREGNGAPYAVDTFECDEDAQQDDDDEDYRSMITAVDIEISRLLTNTPQEDGIDWDSTDTVVIIAIDNGSPAQRVDGDPFLPGKVKGTVAQGGVRVALVIGGAGVTETGQEVFASVSLTDLYATILDIAGKPALIPQDSDSESLVPFFTDAGATPPHDFNYTERFFPNFEPVADPQQDQFGPCQGGQAVQEDPSEYATATYKYVRLFDSAQEGLFDLDADPFETNNLIGDPPDENRLQDLEDHIDLTLDSDLASLCRGKEPTGGDCTATGDSGCCSGNCSGGTCVCETQ